MTTEVLDELNYQLLRRLKKEGLITLKELFIDGTKIEANVKPAYNVQVAAENYFIIHGYVSNDRTDYNTLIPVLEKHRKAFGSSLEEVTADSGYCSEKNLLYLKKKGIAGYIKLQDHEKRKTRAYAEDISKYSNMTYQIYEDVSYSQISSIRKNKKSYGMIKY